MSAPSYGDSDNILLRKIAEGLGSGVQLVSNLDTNPDLGTSDTKYPSQNAVKTYVDHLTISHSALVRTSPVTSIDLAGDTYRTCELDDDVAFTSENHAAGLTVTVLIKAGASSRALSFPVEWKFLGEAAPSSLDSGKEAALTITAFGPDISDVRAAYAAEP